MNKGAGKALDVSASTSEPGTNAQQYSCNDSFAQKWIAISTDTGIKLVSGLSPSLVLDVYAGLNAGNTNVQIWTSNGSSAQR